MIKNMQVYKPSNEDTESLFRVGLKAEIMTEIEQDDVSRLLTQIRDNQSEAPLENQWMKMGFVCPLQFGENVLYQQGDTFALCVGIQERLCPSSVISRVAEQKGAEVAERENRPLYKRELAQFKEAAVAELLPKSHIRMKLITVYFTPQYMLVATGSVKEADDVVAFLREHFNEAGYVFSVSPLSFSTTTSWMSGIVLNGKDETGHFKASRAIALKGKGTVRIKDIGMEGEEVQVHMHDKTVIQLEIEHQPKVGGDAHLLFDLTDQLAFKRIRFSDVVFSTSDAEVGDSVVTKFDCNVALVIPTLVTLLRHIEFSLGLSDRRYEAKLAGAAEVEQFVPLEDLAGHDIRDDFQLVDPDDDEL